MIPPFVRKYIIGEEKYRSLRKTIRKHKLIEKTIRRYTFHNYNFETNNGIYNSEISNPIESIQNIVLNFFK